MKKLLLLFMGIVLVPITAFAQEDDPVDMGIYLDARIQFTKKEQRQMRREQRIHHEVDSLITYRRFRFEAVSVHGNVDRALLGKDKKLFTFNRKQNYVRVYEKDFYTSLYPFTGFMPEDCVKITDCTKEEDNTWFINVELTFMPLGGGSQVRVKYEFVILAKEGFGVLRATSNRGGGPTIYKGWLVAD